MNVEMTSAPGPATETTSTPTGTAETAPLSTTTTTEAAPVAPTTEAAAFVPLTVEAFKVPEGYSVEPRFLDILNNQALDPVARAQSLIDLHAELTTAASEAGSAAREEEQQNWQAEIANDPIYGGAKLPATLESVGRVMDRFAGLKGTERGDAVRLAFDSTGAGNNPQIVRFLADLGEQFREATPLPNPNPTNATRPSTAQLMYGKPAN